MTVHSMTEKAISALADFDRRWQMDETLSEEKKYFLFAVKQLTLYFYALETPAAGQGEPVFLNYFKELTGLTKFFKFLQDYVFDSQKDEPISHDLNELCMNLNQLLVVPNSSGE